MSGHSGHQGGFGGRPNTGRRNTETPNTGHQTLFGDKYDLYPTSTPAPMLPGSSSQKDHFAPHDNRPVPPHPTHPLHPSHASNSRSRPTNPSHSHPRRKLASQGQYGDQLNSFAPEFMAQLPAYPGTILSSNSPSAPLLKETDVNPPPILPRKRKRDEFVHVASTGTRQLYQRTDCCPIFACCRTPQTGIREEGMATAPETLFMPLEDLGANEAFKDLHAAYQDANRISEQRRY
ncbi:hypothetical protein BS47DRAFT_1367593 [Hydnum rufescens UP504]|uniref:Uncharacterized protein n=1 Tax=Hydnum rufescens UP504 TaxID=1448309 RepID=A0A9P6DKC6_9AGAM|nr:hypothetical protein BS47DRAFT_1367593 [Hydnum rufescens UP504]